MGYSRNIQGVFTGYSYVSVMCRLCIGYVSVIYRLSIGTDTMQKSNKNCIFSAKNLVMSVNFSTFAGESGKRGEY